MSTISSIRSKSLNVLKKPQFLLLCTITFLAIVARLLPGPRTIDDSFITFRYARNILAGIGFVYNPGEHVLGTTTPLYTILLTGLGSITGGVAAPFDQIAMLINAFADGMTCIILYLLGKRFGATLAGIGAALVWAIAPFSVTFAIGGLETSVYVLLMMATVLAHLSGRHILAAFLAALAFLTRPDALILIGPLLLDRLWQIYTTHPWRFEKSSSDENPGNPAIRKITLEGLAIGLPVSIWITFSTIYFGSPLPHSIAAKSLAYRLPPTAALVRLLQHYATPFLEYLSLGNWWIGVGLILYPFLYLVGSLKAFRLDRHSWPFLIYPWLYLAIFAIANPLIFRWYLTPPLPVLILMSLVGAEEILRKILAYYRNKLKLVSDSRKAILSNAILICFIVLLPFSLSLRGWTIHPDHGLSHPAPEMAWYQLELLYRQAAGTLMPEINKRSSPPMIAAGDVGVLGFFTNAPILDTVGLNSLQSTKYYPLDPSYYTINYAIPPDLIYDLHPDFLVILEVYGREGLLKDPRFKGAYRLLQEIPTDIYGSQGMLIFESRSEN